MIRLRPLSSPALLALVALAACAPKRVHERPILSNGDRVAGAEAAVERARADAARDRGDALTARDSIAARALASCEPSVCAAIARGEIAIGMSESQVLAATRSTEGAWSIRDAGDATIMVPANTSMAPRDAVAELALVQLRSGRVSAYSYHEPTGVRVVANTQDATLDGRAAALADALLREGDDLTARGELTDALDRYDRAQILRPNDARTDYRIATVLDKQLRPIEALIRYQLFLHRLELEKIDAHGRAYANMADAIAHARERVIVLEKHNR